MADVRAFRGFRYDLGKVGSLSDVVAPPYDVIDPAFQRALYAKSPFNAVRVELTADEPGDAGDKYTRAANALKEWQVAHALTQDTSRSLYVYEQEFAAEGKTFVRRGFLARVRLEPFGTGRIYPHEQTMSGSNSTAPPGSTSRRSSASIRTTGARSRQRLLPSCAAPRQRRRPITSASSTVSG
jgi:uncharacterized protein (DUF1015 family)